METAVAAYRDDEASAEGVADTPFMVTEEQYLEQQQPMARAQVTALPGSDDGWVGFAGFIFILFIGVSLTLGPIAFVVYIVGTAISQWMRGR